MVGKTSTGNNSNLYGQNVVVYRPLYEKYVLYLNGIYANQLKQFEEVVQMMEESKLDVLIMDYETFVYYFRIKNNKLDHFVIDRFIDIIEETSSIGMLVKTDKFRRRSDIFNCFFAPLSNKPFNYQFYFNQILEKRSLSTDNLFNINTYYFYDFIKYLLIFNGLIMAIKVIHVVYERHVVDNGKSNKNKMETCLKINKTNGQLYSLTTKQLDELRRILMESKNKSNLAIQRVFHQHSSLLFIVSFLFFSLITLLF